MAAAPPPGWQPRRLGEERAWTRREDAFLFVFGLGPALGIPPPDMRVRRLVAAFDGALRCVHWGRQVHGATLATVAITPGMTTSVCAGECDGLLTGTRGVGVMVWTADCVPILLAGGGAVAAVHAGWRGAAAGIVTAALEKLRRLAGLRASEVRAYLGPAVGPCHYPVGPEVVAALAARGVDTERWADRDRVDLRAFLLAELEQAGAHRVERVGGCVACANDLASFRRDGPAAGRQLSLVVRVD